MIEREGRSEITGIASGVLFCAALQTRPSVSHTGGISPNVILISPPSSSAFHGEVCTRYKIISSLKITPGLGSVTKR